MHPLACRIFVISMFALLLPAANVIGQCMIVDSVTPYQEGFETSDGNWTKGGTLNDWAWGHPAKPVITGAAGGQNCWITGGLTATAYNAGQRSYITSPCFNFTNLTYPYIEFKVFWETEYKYDGAAFQYSIDNGATWFNVGAVSEAANCLNKNWFNYATISNMTGFGTNKEGWTGTTKTTSGSCSGGNGSGTWLTTSHVMTNLAGKASVKFRFTFGAGTTCNNYDGFAIDDIKIANAPPNTVDFIPNCLPQQKVAFTNISSPCFTAYSWDFGDPASGSANNVNAYNATHAFTGPGSYTVVLTATGSSGTAISVAKIVHIIDVNASITQSITCNNTNNGEVSASVTADIAVTGIAYSWNTTPVSFTPVISGLGAGTYIVTVTSANACAATDTVTLINPQSLSHNLNIVNAACGKSNGTISISENGGRPPYTYIWSPAVSNGSSAGNLPPGYYMIGITDSAGCTDSVKAQIINAGGFALSINTKTDVNCFGGNTGTATASVSGATGIISYQWLPVGGNAATAVNLQAGIYQIVVTDGFGCKDSATIQINQPASALSAGITVGHTTCGQTNGTATVHVTGGVTNYSYQWIPGNYTTDSIYNLPGGTYNVTVTDANGCTITKQADVDSSFALQVNAITPVNILCFGMQTGSAGASVTGGVPPYIYSWTNGTNTYSGNPLQNVTAGVYQLTVADSKGCIAPAQSVTIRQPLQPLGHTVLINDISCTNLAGSAFVYETGGTPSYNYSWSPTGGTASSATGLTVGNYIVTIIDSNSCVDTVHIQIVSSSTVTAAIANYTNVICYRGSNGGATVIATGSAPFSYNWSPAGGNGVTAANLSAGNYTVTVTDNTGCKAAASVQITEPDSISAIITSAATTCGLSNGSASITVSGGTPGYFYNWMPGNFTTQSVNNLATGPYSVTITDFKGCTGTVQTFVDSSVPLSVVVTALNTTCNIFNGSASVTAFNGTPPYNYLWQPGNAVSAAIMNLSPGPYTVTVTDAKGCSNTGNGYVKPSAKPVITSILPIDAKCNGQPSGSATAVITGGILPYLYNWTNGIQSYSSSSIQNIAAGIYQLTVTDSAGCYDVKTTTIGEPQPMLITVTTTATTCGQKNGTAWADVIGGSAPYLYNWSAGVTTDTATRLAAESISVIVTDANGCTQSSGAAWVPPSLPLHIWLGNDTIVCPGNSILLYPGNFKSYRWQDNSTASTYNAAIAGVYKVWVTDSMGCSATASLKVTNECRDILFPDAFTPNTDKRNDEFGPLGTLSAVSDYTLHIYNRWGQLVFISANPYKKWNGKINSTEIASGVYVWIAEYSFDRRPKKIIKGTVLLIR